MLDNNKVKISVIIPAFNAEKTIIKCLMSIIDSGYDNYEIIVIDDGSTDESLRLVKKFADGKQFIKVISQEKLGPSAARNKGLEISNGDVICFVDGDDYVSPDYLKKIAEVFNKTEADVVYFQYTKVDAEGNIISKNYLPDYKTDYFDNLIELSNNDIFGFVWTKACKKEIINNTRFKQDITLFEDELFTCTVLKEPCRLYYLKESLYFYVRTEGTLFYRTNQNYCRLNDLCWNAWNEILPKKAGAEKFLLAKANHMANICKWYGLEQKIKPKDYFLEMSECNFIKISTLNDAVIDAIKKKKWVTVSKAYVTYKLKNKIMRSIHSKGL